MKVNDFPKVTVILRGYTYDQIHTVVKNLIGTELKAVEITMNTPGALETIRKIREEFGDSILVGAGTVLTYTEAQQAIDAGAAFYFLQLYLIRKYWICAEKEVLYQFREHSHHRKYGKAFRMEQIS